MPTTIYLGDFRDLTVGIRREASIDQLWLRTYASNLLIEFVGYLRADYVARRPASFHTIEGIAAVRFQRARRGGLLISARASGGY